MTAISPRIRTVIIVVVVAAVVLYALPSVAHSLGSFISMFFALLVWSFFGFGFLALVIFLARRSTTTVATAPVQATPTTTVTNEEEDEEEGDVAPHLVIGYATGRFKGRNATNAPNKGDAVWMDLATACRGIITVGQQGSGKTSGVFNPFIMQAMQQGWSTLTFAVKSNVPGTVFRLAVHHRSNNASAVAIIAPPGHFDGIPDDFTRMRLNVLAGLSPESAAAAIGDALGDPKDPYWKNAPMRLAQSWLELLYACGDGSWVDLPRVEDKDGNLLRVARRFRLEYSLNALRECIELSGKDLSIVLQVAAEKEAALADAMDEDGKRRRELLEDALRYFTVSYVTAFLQASNGENLLGAIRASLQAPLMALTGDRSIRETFCGETDINLEALLDSGHHVIVAVDDSRFPNAVKMVNLFLFRRFAELAQKRLGRDDISPCLVSMDEYGSYASRDHLRVLSRAREAVFVPVVGVQSLSFLADAMGQSMDAAKAVLGSMATVIACGASDPETANWIRLRCGQSTVRERVVSHNSGTSTAPNTGQGGNIFSMFVPNETTTAGTSESVQSREKDLAGADTLSTLGPRVEHNLVRAVVIAAQHNGETRDVVRLPMVFVDLKTTLPGTNEATGA